MKITFYIDYLNEVGGVETWLYNIAQIYGKYHDITVYYSGGDHNQLERLKRYVKLRRFYGQDIFCDLAIFCYNVNNSIVDRFKAKRKVQFVHACYSNAYKINKMELDPRIDEYIAVSQVVADDFYNLTGYMPRVVYNPIVVETPKKVLRLISATRITEDKGPIWENMEKLAKELEKNNIPFLWLVFSPKKINTDIKGFMFMNTELSILKYVKDADYLVQLSKTEGYSYSIVESLCVGTPVIATNFPATKEIGLVDGENGYILKMDLSNIDVNKIYNNIPNKFTYKKRDSDKEWKKLLGPSIRVDKEAKVKVICIHREGFFDNEANKRRVFNETWYTDRDRALELYNFTDCQLIDIIEEKGGKEDGRNKK